MPVAIEAPSAEPEIADLRERRLRRGSIRERGKRLKIGLVNNMPDAAWSATERQFAGLLDEAADDFDIRLTLWSLETVDRQVETRREMAGRYRAAREMRGADLCCGSAGIYNITQNEMSMRLLAEKMEAVNAAGTEIIATANPGCILQLRAGVRMHGKKQRVMHVVEVLDEAYRNG